VLLQGERFVFSGDSRMRRLYLQPTVVVPFQYFMGALLVLVVSAAWAQNKPHAHHHAHAHGQGELELAIEKGRVQGTLRVPMESLLGFEHAPKTDAKRGQVAALRKLLENPNNIVAPPANAACQVIESVAESALFSGTVKGGHSELAYTFGWDCAKPDQLTSLGLPVFASYKRLKQLEVSLVVNGQQSAVRRNPKSATISLR
jgi:hypothetical protein